MINVIIAEENMEKAATLINSINRSNKNIRVVNISKKVEEILDVLNRQGDIDVIIFNLETTEFEIEKLNSIKEYKKIVIIVSDNIKGIKLKNNIYQVVDKASNIVKLKNIENNLLKCKMIKKKKENVSRRIIEELSYLGYDTSHKGTIYLKECIFYVKIHPEMYFENLRKDLYPIIAGKYEEKIHNLRCYISRETTMMYVKCDNRKLQKYFSIVDDYKPNVKTVINTIANKINY